jgi:hypothetical protein
MSGLLTVHIVVHMPGLVPLDELSNKILLLSVNLRVSSAELNKLSAGP